jgi:hypothetical protein
MGTENAFGTAIVLDEASFWNKREKREEESELNIQWQGS